MLLYDCSSLHCCGLAVVIFDHNIISAIFLSDHFFGREGVSVVMLMFTGSRPQRRRLHASTPIFLTSSIEDFIEASC